MLLIQTSKPLSKPNKSLQRSNFGFLKAILTTNSTFSSKSTGGFETKANRFRKPWRLARSKPLCAFRNFFRMSCVRFMGFIGLSLSGKFFRSADEYAMLISERSLTSFLCAVSLSRMSVEPEAMWFLNVFAVFFCDSLPMPSTRNSVFFLSVATPIQIWFWDIPRS